MLILFSKRDKKYKPIIKKVQKILLFFINALILDFPQII